MTEPRTCCLRYVSVRNQSLKQTNHCCRPSCTVPSWIPRNVAPVTCKDWPRNLAPVTCKYWPHNVAPVTRNCLPDNLVPVTWNSFPDNVALVTCNFWPHNVAPVTRNSVWRRTSLRQRDACNPKYSTQADHPRLFSPANTCNLDTATWVANPEL